jgi:hypothetical protein
MGQRAADDSAVARQRGLRKRCLVSIRGNDSKNESRLKTYGRFLDRFYALDGRNCGENGGEAGAGQGQKATRPEEQRSQRAFGAKTLPPWLSQSQRSLICRCVLSDGAWVNASDRDPELPGPVPLTTEQQKELSRLASRKKGEFLGSAQVQVLGTAVTLQSASANRAKGANGHLELVWVVLGGFWASQRN